MVLALADLVSSAGLSGVWFIVRRVLLVRRRERSEMAFRLGPLAGVVGILVLAFTPYGGGLSRADGSVKALLVGEMQNFTLSSAPEPVPEASFQTPSEETITLEHFRGKVVLVNLWATWCHPCRREMPELDHLQGKLGGEDFEVVIIAQERGGRPKVEAFLSEIGVTHLVAYVDQSTKSSRAFRVRGLPTTFLVDRQGREVGRMVGPADWSSPEAVALIRHFIAQPG
jgi:thiol-disulfide isomerase/thioredoxin